MSESKTLEQLTLFAVDSRAKTLQWPITAADWLEADPDSGLSSIELLESLRRDGLLSKTSPAFYPLTEAGTLPLSFGGWQSAGIMRPGESLTLNISASPSNAEECLLSQVLETEVAPVFYLKPSRIKSILSREIPPRLRSMLTKSVAAMGGQKAEK
jgi:hypothetical protein